MTLLVKFTLALALILAAIGKSAATETSVVASIFPLHSLTAGVMKGAGEPVLLLDSGLSPHDFTLKPSQAELLQSADLLIWIGGDFEYPLAGFAGNLPPGQSLALGAGGPDGRNPHIWLDPQQAKRIASAIAERLRGLDPDHGALYMENAVALSARIDTLELELAALLQPVRDVPYVVFHDAFEPFESHFGMNNAGALTREPERGLSAGQIRRMRATIAASGAHCAFREPQFDPHLLDVVAEQSDIRMAALDPLGWKLEPEINGYFILMRNLAHDFVACLSRR
jgi:zinc transport system substrate-binding protein